LLLNPTLSDLVGGIESVTLSDDEARRRGTQKTVLERRAPPTFDVLIEIQDREQLLVHPDVTASVDSMLRGQPFRVEFRSRDEAGQVQVEQQSAVVTSAAVTGRRDAGPRREKTREDRNGRIFTNGSSRTNETKPTPALPTEPVPYEEESDTLHVFAYGVARNRLIQAARRLKVNITLVNTLPEADVLVTLKSYYRKRRQLINDAERRRTPVYVLRANTTNQMESFLIQVMNLDAPSSADPFEAAIAEAERGIELIQAGQASVDLRPVGSAIRRYQHQMIRQANLVSHSYGKEPNRYVRIFSASRDN
jgi:hypothetical protein